MSRKLVGGTGLALGIAAILYALLIYYRHRPVPVYTHTPFRYPEYDEKINKILEDLKTDPEKGREQFRRLSEKVEGGRQWVLLRMAAFENRKKQYKTIEESKKPLLKLASGRAASSGQQQLVLSVENKGRTSIYVPLIPEKAQCIIRDEQGTSRTVKLPRSLFGDPVEQGVVILQPQAFWGISIPFPLEEIGKGSWNISIRLIYSKETVNGLNVLQGTYTSNQISFAR